MACIRNERENHLEWIRLIGMCLLTAVLVVILKEMNPVAAGLLCAAFGVMLLSESLPEIRRYVAAIGQFLSGVGLEGEYYSVLLKAMGITLVTQLAEQICRDMGVHAVAERVELCGRLAMMGIAIPIFLELTRITVDVLL